MKVDLPTVWWSQKKEIERSVVTEENCLGRELQIRIQKKKSVISMKHNFQRLIWIKQNIIWIKTEIIAIQKWLKFWDWLYKRFLNSLHKLDLSLHRWESLVYFPLLAPKNQQPIGRINPSVRNALFSLGQVLQLDYRKFLVSHNAYGIGLLDICPRMIFYGHYLLSFSDNQERDCNLCLLF